MDNESLKKQITEIKYEYIQFTKNWKLEIGWINQTNLRVER